MKIPLDAVERSTLACYTLQHFVTSVPACNLHIRPAMSFELEGITYYTAADVARDIGVSRQTLWRWRQEGKIPLGRRYRDRQVVFTAEELRTVRGFAHRIEPIDGPSPAQLKLSGGRRT